MKKPEFPKPRLIREDFLPEPTVEQRYRIKKITKGNGEVWYYPQKKILWFWINLVSGEGCYSWQKWAQETIYKDYVNSQKNKVEYLPPDFSTFEQPNPPPKEP